MAIAGVQLKAPSHFGARNIPRVAEVLNPGVYRPARSQAELDAGRLRIEVPEEAPRRLPMFTAAFVLEHPEAAAAALNSCYYDLVDLEKRLPGR